MNRPTILVALAAAALVGLGFLHPFGDPRAERPRGHDTLLSGADLPPAAKEVLLAKCADCHSGETRWPIYSRLAPGSWLIERDIMEARGKMDLSHWQELSPDTQEILRGKILHEAGAGEMPPLPYRLLHWNARLTPQDLTALATLRPAEASQSVMAGPGDPARGQAVFERRCTGCHALSTDREGPRLAGVFGRQAGSVPGFAYSAGLKKAGITWNEATLNRWLTDPDTMVPGNAMDFHVPKVQERSDLVAYFRQERLRR